MDPFIGEIRMFAGNFAPRGWAYCDGQLLSISQNDALFSLLGTTYGGDGRTTFGLPEMRGRVPLHMGQGPGLSSRPIGQKSGQERVVLSQNNLPAHTHTVAAGGAANDKDPSGAVLGVPASPAYALEGHTMEMNRRAIGPAGSGTGAPWNHDNVQPFQCIHYIIALVGIYPSRN
jgi:microcystin-dependent protein